MFISYTYKKYIGYDKETELHSYEYELTDSEFGTVSGTVAVAGGGAGVGAGVGAAVINEYEKRNLPVAANLMKVILFIHKKYGWPVNKVIELSKRYNPKFPKYEKDIEKYLTLL